MSQLEEAARESLEPFDRAAASAGSNEGPYQVQIDLQEMMQSLVGIVRREEEMAARSRWAGQAVGTLKKGRRRGPSRIQPRLAHGARLESSCSPFPKQSHFRLSNAKKAGADISATISRTKTPASGKMNIVALQGRRRFDANATGANSSKCRQTLSKSSKRWNEYEGLQDLARRRQRRKLRGL